MRDVLAEIVADTRVRVDRRQRPGRRFRDALARPGVSVIAEHKRSSPSAGVIRDDLRLADVVGAYERGGAAALSILTEESRFGGSLEDVRSARAVTELPIVRKDFIVDAFQVAEAAVAGADAILLIVAALAEPDLRALAGLAQELRLDVLMEVHDAAELEVAIDLGAPIIGINNRNLATLQVDLATTFALRPRIPDSTIVVAESGFSTPEQIAALGAAGVDAVLIGEALMRAPDIEAATRAITARGRG